MERQFNLLKYLILSKVSSYLISFDLEKFFNDSLGQMKKLIKRTLYFITGLGILYLLLLIPDSKEKHIVTETVHKPFEWKRDDQWLQMEELFRQAKQMDKAKLDSIILVHKTIVEDELALLQTKNITASEPGWIKIENNYFVLASLIAVQQDQIPWLVDYYNMVRNLVKSQSQQWNMNDPVARNTVYMLLYGMRAAVEEVLLQTESLNFPAAMLVKNERSVTPAASIFGIEVHSGDLLVSRAGAEVSAMISRGNDYPGNFSHVALVYVEEKTKEPFLI